MTWENVSFDIGLKNVLGSRNVVTLVVIRGLKAVRIIQNSELLKYPCTSSPR
jgi:hypothetical protein